MSGGVWLLASRLLGRPVPLDENPHVCGQLVGTERDGVTPIMMNRAGCAACPAMPAQQRPARTTRPTPSGRY